MYFLFRSGVSLDSVFKMLRKRFRAIDYNEYDLRKALVYFSDAESEPMPNMIRNVSWGKVREAIVAEVRRLT